VNAKEGKTQKENHMSGNLQKLVDFDYLEVVLE
jgi:hypothetical protein